MKNKMFATVGMCGSGKSVACSYLERHGYSKVYFGGVTIEELEKRNMEVNEANEKKIREFLRCQYGMGAFALLSLPKIEQQYKEGNVVLDGLYSWAEYLILRDKFPDSLEVIAMICDKEIRYRRLSVREIRPLSREEALKRDYAEIENIQKGGPIAFADYFVENNGTIEETEMKLERIMRR